MDGHNMPPSWISELTNLREDLTREVREVEEVSHVRAEHNPAVLGMRELAKPIKLN